jgi:hypothetical protein
VRCCTSGSGPVGCCGGTVVGSAACRLRRGAPAALDWRPPQRRSWSAVLAGAQSGGGSGDSSSSASSAPRSFSGSAAYRAFVGTRRRRARARQAERIPPPHRWVRCEHVSRGSAVEGRAGPGGAHRTKGGCDDRDVLCRRRSRKAAVEAGFSKRAGERARASAPARGPRRLTPKFSCMRRRRNSAPAPQPGAACRLQRHVRRGGAAPPHEDTPGSFRRQSGAVEQATVP